MMAEFHFDQAPGIVHAGSLSHRHVELGDMEKLKYHNMF